MNYHKLSGSKQHLLSYSSVDWKSDTGFTELTSVFQQGCISFWSCRDNLFPGLFLVLQTVRILWLMTPFLHLQIRKWWVESLSHFITQIFLIVTSSSDHSWERLSTFKTSYYYVESSQVIQNIPNLRSADQ